MDPKILQRFSTSIYAFLSTYRMKKKCINNHTKVHQNRCFKHDLQKQSAGRQTQHTTTQCLQRRSLKSGRRSCSDICDPLECYRSSRDTEAFIIWVNVCVILTRISPVEPRRRGLAPERTLAHCNSIALNFVSLSSSGLFCSGCFDYTYRSPISLAWRERIVIFFFQRYQEKSFFLTWKILEDIF